MATSGRNDIEVSQIMQIKTDFLFPRFAYHFFYKIN